MKTETVLIVDDDANTLKSLEFILTAAGFTVLTASNGVIALNLILDALKGRYPVRLIITDIQMPVLSGLDLIDRLRQMNAGIPVLVITAYRDGPLEGELRLRRCAEILDKPLNDETLIARVNDLVGRCEEQEVHT